MKALSVHQPWASLIAAGKKTIEVRSWATSHRGPLLICATKRPHGDDPVGVAVGVVNLIDVRRFLPSDAAGAGFEGSADKYAWELADAQAIEPFPVTGNMGLFTVEVPKLKRIRTTRRRDRTSRDSSESRE